LASIKRRKASRVTWDCCLQTRIGRSNSKRAWTNNGHASEGAQIPPLSKFDSHESIKSKSSPPVTDVSDWHPTLLATNFCRFSHYCHFHTLLMKWERNRCSSGMEWRQH
jgi:hypothetical protein